METTKEEEEEKQEVWSWGAGTDGQLATGRIQDEHLPQLLPCSLFQHPISNLSCGGAHVIALLQGTNYYRYMCVDVWACLFKYLDWIIEKMVNLFI